MQQTEKYQLNLVEADDVFSPAPLNENMEKLETALDTGLAEVMTAIGVGGQTARIAWGTYTGDGAAAKTLTFDFKPVLVVVSGGHTAVLVRGCPSTLNIISVNSTISGVTWGENSMTLGMNNSGGTYPYMAIGVPLEEAE